MKKLWIMIPILLLLFGCSAKVNVTVAPEQLIGKTLDQTAPLLQLDNQLLAYGYGFALDCFDNPVVLEWDINEQCQICITNAVVFDKYTINNSPRSFDSLEAGMTIVQVVEKVGIPVSIPVTGIFYLEFADNMGDIYMISWSGDPLCIDAIAGQ